MTYFLLHDELELALEPLEQDVCLHALATTAYTSLGHASAKRCLDGAVPTWLIAKRLPTWKPELVERATKALVSVGLWEAREDGYAFVDWDLHQFTKEQEQARKAKQNERQRRRRAKPALLENIAENENVTRDVARDVTPPLAFPFSSPFLSQNSPSENELLPEPTQEPAAKKPKKVRARSAHDEAMELVKKSFGEEYQARYGQPYGVFNMALLSQASCWVKQQPDPHKAVKASLGGYFADTWWQSKGNPFQGWARDPAPFSARQTPPKPQAEKYPVAYVNGFRV